MNLDPYYTSKRASYEFDVRYEMMGNSRRKYLQYLEAIDHVDNEVQTKEKCVWGILTLIYLLKMASYEVIIYEMIG